MNQLYIITDDLQTIGYTCNIVVVQGKYKCNNSKILHYHEHNSTETRIFMTSHLLCIHCNGGRPIPLT